MYQTDMRNLRNHLPLIALTMGDPSGIGPEIILKALVNPVLFEHCRPLVLGDKRILQRALGWLDIPLVAFDVVDNAEDGRYESGFLTMLDFQNADPDVCPVGQISADSGTAAVEYVQRACDLAMANTVQAMVTAPLNKDAMNKAGFHYAGHTELLTERTGATNVSMLLTSPSLRVVHVSTHVPLAEAIACVTPDRVETVIDLAYTACRALGISAPRIAIAGLNPHAGEGGLFGDQERVAILPAIYKARKKGYCVSDPQPPDTVFLRASHGVYDIVVAMYHDQGHIPVKLVGFHWDGNAWSSVSGVNITIGLPIIRTSVDHGTAFGKAGKGLANEKSLLDAIDYAILIAKNRGIEVKR